MPFSKGKQTFIYIIKTSEITDFVSWASEGAVTMQSAPAGKESNNRCQG
jgi:hypothetical protein